MSQTKTQLVEGLNINTSAPADALAVANDGDVGIGTTSPNYKLHLHSATTGDSNYLQITHADAGSGASDGLQLGLATGSSPDAYLAQKENGALIFQTNAQNRARIDSSGRLLVGTSTARSNVRFNATNTTPSFQIETATNSWNNGLSIINNSSGTYAATLRLGTTGGDAIGSNTLAGAEIGKISFHGADGTNLLEAARINCVIDNTAGANDMPARLMFATTADGQSAPTERMRLASTGVNYVWNNNASTAFIAASGAGNSTTVVIAARRSAGSIDGGTNAYFIYANGSAGNASDVNLKKNIETTRDGYLEDLNRLRVVKYNWNDQEDTEPRELGLIAQEVEEVFPGLACDMSNNDEGGDKATVKGIKYSVLPVMLLKALQEADAKIEAQAAQIATQAATIAAFEARLTALEGAG